MAYITQNKQMLNSLKILIRKTKKELVKVLQTVKQLTDDN